MCIKKCFRVDVLHLVHFIDEMIKGKKMTKKLIYSSILGIALLSGCSTDDETTPTPSSTPTNRAPIVNAGADKTVTVNETVTITGTATDSDGTISSIEWKKGSEVLATTLSFSYTATKVGTDTLTLVVMDDDGATASDNVNVVITSSSDNPFDDVKK